MEELGNIAINGGIYDSPHHALTINGGIYDSPHHALTINGGIYDSPHHALTINGGIYDTPHHALTTGIQGSEESNTYDYAAIPVGVMPVTVSLASLGSLNILRNFLHSHVMLNWNVTQPLITTPPSMNTVTWSRIMMMSLKRYHSLTIWPLLVPHLIIGRESWWTSGRGGGRLILYTSSERR